MPKLKVADFRLDQVPAARQGRGFVGFLLRGRGVLGKKRGD